MRSVTTEVHSSLDPTQAQRRSRALIITTIFLSLVGAGISVALTQHYYDLRSGMAGFQSFCNLGTQMNCDQVAASPYAEVFGSLPLSSLGAGFFLALLLASVFALNPYWRREALRISLGLTSTAAVLSLGYLAVMISILKTYCVLCLTIDALVFGSLLIVVALKPEGFSVHPPDFKKLRTLGILVTLAVGLTAILLTAFDKNRLPSDRAKEWAQTILASPSLSISSGTDVPSFGSASAPIRIVEFSDFQCPYCRLGAFTVNAVLSRYPGKVRVEFRNFPLDQKCNPEMSFSPHVVACDAARIAICAHKQGKFEPVYQGFFENQASLATGRMTEIMNQVGVDAAQMNTCLESPEPSAAITRDLQEGGLLGVKSTPIFFINGHKMEGALPLPVWVEVIETLLKNETRQ